MVFIYFLLLSIIVIYSGKKLSIYGDVIGDAKKLEKSWIGIVMLASITSLPELITSGSASFLGNPDMAVSNIFGSNMFNIFIIFILDYIILKKISFTNSIHPKNILTGLLSLGLTLIFIMGYVLGDITFFGFSIFSAIIMIGYIFSMKYIYIFERDLVEEISQEEEEFIPDMPYKKAKFGFIIMAGLVIISGVLLVKVASIISVTPIFGIKLGSSFVGVIFLALATSLPELTVSVQAVKLGSYDMAAGNLLGSNLFNIAIIFIADLFATQKRLMEEIQDFQIIAALFSILLLVVMMIGTISREKKKRGDSLLIGIIYIIGMYILYKMR
ncbi:MAG: sodium:calcium antiporter [Fusobacteriota bacterium]